MNASFRVREGGAPPPGPHDEDLIERVKRVLLERIARESMARHVTVHAGPEGWQPLLAGVCCKVLHEQDQVRSCLLRLEPGAVLPLHQHAVDEECIVLEGELCIGGQLVVRAGDYHLGRSGVPHATITSRCGALLFLRGAVPDCAGCARSCNGSGPPDAGRN